MQAFLHACGHWLLYSSAPHLGRHLISEIACLCRHLHTDFTYQAPSPINIGGSFLAAEYTFQTHVTAPTACDGVIPCPICQGLYNPGRWLSNGQQPSLQHTCVYPSYFHGCHPLETTSVVGASGLRWQPLQCNFQTPDRLDMPNCLANRHVCIVGDSHARHTFNSLVQIIEGTTQDSASTQFDRQPERTVYGTYISDPYGDLLAYDTACSTLVVNIGQWFASWKHGRDFDLAHLLLTYMVKLRQVASRMKAAQAAGVEVIWMTTNAHAITLHQHAPDPVVLRDRRTDPVLLLLNRIADSIMSAAGIPIFDTWSMTAPVFDLSYDGAHYKGDVGYSIGLALLNHLCSGNEV